MGPGAQEAQEGEEPEEEVEKEDATGSDMRRDRMALGALLHRDRPVAVFAENDQRK